jgi:acetoin utilization protein AcuC
LKTAFLYSEKFADVSYGAEHPMRPERLRLAYESIKECGLFSMNACVVRARKATEDEVLLFHTPEYIKALKEADSGVIPAGGPLYGMGCGDNPCFRGVFEWSLYTTGASVQAAELVADKKTGIAFNIGGGLHHALPDRASGFCYINDPAVAIKKLLLSGKRVAYIDIDAHHGDGVERAFYDTDRVLTVSIHESGEYLFPGTGFPQNFGNGPGLGYAVNLPMPPGAGDELFVKGFLEIVPPFIEAFAPDIIVTQLGVDTFSVDPITHLELTTNGFEEMIRTFKSFGLPWVALGGGGYDIDAVKRAWTIAWAIMNDSTFLEKLRDSPVPEKVSAEGRRRAERDIEFLKKEVLPLVRG